MTEPRTARLVTRLTRREWAIRIVAILVAFSFVSGIFYALFEAI